MCEIQQHLYLISSAIQIDLQPCKGNLITRHVGTQGVPHGNLSRAHTESSPSHPTQGYCPDLLAHGCEPAAFSMITVLALKEGVPPSKEYSASNLAIFKVTSVY